MRKRTKFLVIAIVAVLVLTAGIATTVFASGSSGAESDGVKVLLAENVQEVVTEEGDEDEGPLQTFISKVASILGVTEEELTDAFEQACQEMCDEALEQRLQEAVLAGYLTQEEADQIMEWWQSRPDVLEGCCLPGHFAGGVLCHQLLLDEGQNGCTRFWKGGRGNMMARLGVD
jgi:hypothetical protein